MKAGTIGEFYEFCKTASLGELRAKKLEYFKALKNTLDNELYGLATKGVCEMYKLITAIWEKENEQKGVQNV